jgi:hypothetical protein
MSDLEQELRAMADVTAPPATTGLDDVLRRGRRRVYALRAGAAAGVVAVIAGAGFTALTLRGAPTSLPPADGGPAVTTTNAAPIVQVTPWPRVDLPLPVPYGTWSPGESAPPAPGRSVPPIPLCSTPDDRVSQLARSAPMAPAVAKAVGEVVGLVAPLAVPSDLKTAVLRPDTPEASYFQWIDVTDAGGTGSVVISEGHFPGAPVDAADRDAFADRNCSPPNRLVTDDGTVLQYASPAPWEPFQSLTQTLRIYRPDGTLVELEQRNYGSPDLRVNEDDWSFDHFGKGRGTLPLTAEQLMAIGDYVVHVG